MKLIIFFSWPYIYAVARYPAAGNDTQNARYPAARNDTQNASKMLDTRQPGKIQKFEKLFDTCDRE